MSNDHVSLPTVPPGSQDSLPRLVTIDGTSPTVPPGRQDFPPTLLGTGPSVESVQKVGNYKILGTLGSGGMGIVYKAFDQKLGRIVALKMLHLGREASPEEIARFRSEAEMLGRLQHPNIVQVFDYGVHEGAPYLVMEFVNAGSLDKKLQGTPQAPRRAAEWIEQLARAIHAAHENKVIHRDLKPANVLVTAEGALKITDFGLAKQLEVNHGLTQTGCVMGTPSYMAPEQAEGKKTVGPAADVYSLGAILYECLTGRPPFRGVTLQETLEQVCHAEPAPPSRLVPRLPRDVQTICLKCLHKAPGRRYATAQDLADDLKNFLDGLAVKARPEHSFKKLIRIVARRPLRAALAAAGLLVVILVVVLGLHIREQGQQAKLDRQTEAARTAEIAQQQEREEHEASLKNLRDVLGLTMDGDLNTVAGLAKLEEHLNGNAQEALAEAATPPEVLLVLASAFHKLAGRYRRLGDPAKAITPLNLAEELVTRELKVRPGGAAERLLARIHLKRGMARSDLGDSAAAKEDCKKALELLGGSRPKGIGGVEHDRVRAKTLLYLAIEIGREKEGHEEASRHYEQALAIRRKLAHHENATVEDRRDLAQTLGYQGDLYLRMKNKHSEADAAFWESHETREAMAKEAPENYNYENQVQLGRSWENFGRHQTLRRAPTTALFFLGHSEKIRRELNRRQPDNREYALELASVRNRIVELRLLAGALKDADKVCDENARSLEALMPKDREPKSSDKTQSSDTVVRILLAECHALKGRLLLAGSATGPPVLGPAGDSLRKRRALLQEVLVSHGRLSPEERYVLAAAESLAAEVTAAASQAQPVKGDSRSAEKAKANLLEAIEKGFRRLHPDDVANDRAFRRVKDEQWFIQALQSMREASPALRVPQKSPAG